MSISLNAEQSRQLKRSTEVENLFSKNKDKITGLKPIQKQVNLLIGNNKKINEYMPARTENGKGTTTEKGDLKIVIAEEVDNICSFAKVYALDIENTQLFNTVNYTYSDVRNMRDPEVYGFVTTLVGIITPLLSVPEFMEYPVTVENLDTLTADATTYNESLGSARIIDSNNSDASQNIDILLKENAVIIRKLNSLMNYYKTSDSKFYKEYHDVAVIDYSNVHHSGIKGTIKGSNGIPIFEVIVTGEGKNKQTKTDKLGRYELTKIRAGLRTFTFAAPGFEEQKITIQIIRGKILDLNIELIAKMVSLSATA